MFLVPGRRYRFVVDAATWAPWLEIAYGVAALLLAILVFWFAPRVQERRILALLLFIEGIGIGGIVAGIAHLRLYGGAVEAGLWGILSVSLLARSFLYLVWIGAALKVPSTRWLDTRAGRFGMAGAFVVVFLVYLLDGEAGAPRGWVRVGAPALYFMVSLYGLFAALGAFQVTVPGTLAHTRVRSYLVAFGIRDGAAFILLPAFIANVVLTGGVNLMGHVILAGLQLAYIAFLLALGHGILHGRYIGLDDAAIARFGHVLSVAGLVTLAGLVTAIAALYTRPALAAAIGALAGLFGASLWRPWDSGMGRLAAAMVRPQIDETLPLRVRQARYAEHHRELAGDTGDGTLEHLRLLLGLTVRQATEAVGDGFVVDLRRARGASVAKAPEDS